jgi:hypothetical protein
LDEPLRRRDAEKKSIKEAGKTGDEGFAYLEMGFPGFFDFRITFSMSGRIDGFVARDSYSRR